MLFSVVLSIYIIAMSLPAGNACQYRIWICPCVWIDMTSCCLLSGLPACWSFCCDYKIQQFLLSFTGDSQESQPLQHTRSVGRPPTNGRTSQLQRGQSGTGSGMRQKESLFQRIKRAASQPALAGPSAPPVSQVAQSAIASISSIAGSDSR